VSNPPTNKIPLVFIWDPSMLRICWAKKSTFKNLNAFSFHQINGFATSSITITLQNNDNLETNRTSLASLVDIITLKKKSTTNFATCELLLPPTWFKNRLALMGKGIMILIFILKNKNLDQLPTHTSLMQLEFLYQGSKINVNMLWAFPFEFQ
jgi:hypothetical protein